MSEINTDRTLETIQKEYGDMCFKAGSFQYQIVTLQKDLDILNGQIRDLNFEAAAVIAKSKEKASE